MSRTFKRGHIHRKSKRFNDDDTYLIFLRSERIDCDVIPLINLKNKMIQKEIKQETNE